MPLENLPVELLYQVFSYIDSRQDLTQCRLVCKQLNRFAERAMFLKPITIKSVSEARSLLSHLTANNELGKLITSLDLKTVPEKQVDVYLKLLPLVFTPAMETFQGVIMAPVFYQHLVHVAQASNTSFKKLKVIPTELFYGSDDYCDAVCHFKETLQQVHITWIERPRWRAFRQLGELDNLTRLTIDGGINSVFTFDMMLLHCTRLQTLSVTLPGLAPMVMKHDKLVDWMEKSVSKVPSLTKLVIEKARQPDVVEYLLYKYPNVKETVLLLNEPEYYEGHLSFHDLWRDGGEEFNTEPLDRILEAMQNLPFYRIGYMPHVLEDVLETIRVNLDYYHQHDVTYSEGPSPGWMDITVYNYDDEEDSD